MWEYFTRVQFNFLLVKTENGKIFEIERRKNATRNNNRPSCPSHSNTTGRPSDKRRASSQSSSKFKSSLMKKIEKEAKIFRMWKYVQN